ncbi:MAG: hypothetical protein HYR72_16830 [Deltaproteobacteria bacterium]|nr:hypothetical protein [Deltaproteobacteria bacterium]MBI3389869.1 hypothetical protein [Deltaproteobacteria bacterium]
MNSELTLTGAITRKTSGEDSRQLVQLLEAEIAGSLGYVRRAAPGIYADAGTWLLVLSSVASAVTIAEALRKVYQRFARSPEEPEGCQRLVVQFKDASGRFSQVTIDGQTDQDVLIEQVSKSIETVVSAGSGVESRQRLEDSGQWIRVSKAP